MIMMRIGLPVLTTKYGRFAFRETSFEYDLYYSLIFHLLADLGLDSSENLSRIKQLNSIGAFLVGCTRSLSVLPPFDEAHNPRRGVSELSKFIPNANLNKGQAESKS